MIFKHFGQRSRFCGVIKAHILVQVLFTDHNSLIRLWNFNRFSSINFWVGKTFLFRIKNRKTLINHIDFKFERRWHFNISCMMHLLKYKKDILKLVEIENHLVVLIWCLNFGFQFRNRWGATFLFRKNLLYWFKLNYEGICLDVFKKLLVSNFHLLFSYLLESVECTAGFVSLGIQMSQLLPILRLNKRNNIFKLDPHAVLILHLSVVIRVPTKFLAYGLVFSLSQPTTWQMLCCYIALRYMFWQRFSFLRLFAYVFRWYNWSIVRRIWTLFWRWKQSQRCNRHFLTICYLVTVLWST